jgi:hypothetical protein
MKKLVWVAAGVVLLSLVFPNGISLPQPKPDVVTPVGETDSTMVALLRTADAADKARIVSVYEGMKRVISRDGGKRVSNTEKWAEFQANTLQLAIEQPGKYPGLDVAIDNVFLKQVGTDDVIPTNPETQQKLLKACEIIVNSAR